MQYDAQVARQGSGWVWATISAAVPVAGSFGAAQLFAWAARDTSGLQGWLFASGAVAITAAVGVTIASKVVEQRRGTSTARAKRNQLVKLRDEFMPLASTTADMARQPLVVRQAHLKAVSATAAAALRSVVGEHVSNEVSPLTAESWGWLCARQTLFTETVGIPGLSRRSERTPINDPRSVRPTAAVRYAEVPTAVTTGCATQSGWSGYVPAIVERTRHTILRCKTQDNRQSFGHQAI